MLKAEEQEQQGGGEGEPPILVTSTNELTRNQGGPQSPVTYAVPAPSSPREHHKRRLQFNMSNKIQMIPDNRQGQLNTVFLATVPGVLKLAEIALTFLSFILTICADRNATTSAFTEHISVAASLVISGLLLGYVCFPHLTLKDERTREGLIVVELLFYGISTLLFFIAIWLMVHLSASWMTYGRGSAIIDAVVCVALTILFAIETIAKLRAWRSENDPSNQILQTGGTMEAGQHYEPNAELRRGHDPEQV